MWESRFRDKRPNFLTQLPTEYFAKVLAPLYLLFFVTVYCLKMWQFGNDTGSFQLVEGLWGATIFEIVTMAICLINKCRSVTNYFRFLIFYLAFVPHLSLAYMEKLLDFSYIFAMREDFVNHKWSGLIALWTADWSHYLQILIPVLILVIGARQMNSSNDREHRFPVRYFVLLAIAAVLLVLMIFFSGIINLAQYMVAVILVYIVSDAWDQVRDLPSFEPVALISWAEILMFVAIFCKGVMEIFER